MLKEIDMSIEKNVSEFLKQNREKNKVDSDVLNVLLNKKEELETDEPEKDKEVDDKNEENDGDNV